jgi:hypothetical protein
MRRRYSQWRLNEQNLHPQWFNVPELPLPQNAELCGSLNFEQMNPIKKYPPENGTVQVAVKCTEWQGMRDARLLMKLSDD